MGRVETISFCVAVQRQGLITGLGLTSWDLRYFVDQTRYI